MAEDKGSPKEAELKKSELQLEVIAAELDREIASQAQRSSAMEQRATILVGAASVVGALQVSTEISWVTVVNLGLSFLAAVAGVVIVFPRRGDALDIRTVRDGLLELPVLEGKYKLIDTKLEILEEDEGWLTVRGWIARVGFAALALSIAATLIGAVTPDSPKEPAPEQVETTQSW